MSINFDNKLFTDAPTTLQGDLSNLINNSTAAYLQLEHPQQTTILLQKGIYPEEMLEKIAHTYGMPF